MINSIKKLRKVLLQAKRGLPAQAGFTLVETLIAIFVLMLSITGPLTLAAKGLQATLIAKDQDTAFYLAQDAVEYVRFVRDSNRLKNNSWLAGLDGTANGFTQVDGVNGDCVSAGGTQFCTVDSLQPSGQNAIVSCGASGAACPALKYDPTINHFTYTSGGGVTSIFTRTLSIATPVGGNAGEASVTVTVSWRDPQTHSITVREDILNWQ